MRMTLSRTAMRIRDRPSTAICVLGAWSVLACLAGAHPASAQSGLGAPGCSPVASAPAGAAGCRADEARAQKPRARPFAPGSYVNKPLRSGTAIDPASSAYAAEFRRQVKRYRPWVNTGQFSTPVYTVSRRRKTVRVRLDTAYSPLQRAWEAVPIPSGARAAAGSDQHLVVWQPSTDTMWEFWHLRREADGWHARWGGRMTRVSRNPGYYDIKRPISRGDAGSGATGSSIPLLAGLIRGSEMERGSIRHALAVALPETRPSEWVWPAQRTDGFYWTSGVPRIPEGARFRLDPRLDVDSLGLSRPATLIARAIQRYGMVVRDKSGAVSFYAEDPLTAGPRLNELFTGRPPAQSKLVYLSEAGGFPWQHLQLLSLGEPRSP